MAVQTAKISVQNRTELGSRAMGRLRATGIMPAVIYGHKQAVLPIKMNRKEITNHIDKGSHVFELDVEGATETVLIKDAQYDYLGTFLIHVDFTRVRLDEKVTVTVPVELKGTPKGEADGGKLQQLIADLQVECLVLDIPSIIRHVVTDMGMDSVLHVKELKLPDGVRCLQDGDQVVAMVREVKEEEAAAAVEAAATVEPEVIGKKDKEAAAEGAAAPAPAAKK